MSPVLYCFDVRKDGEITNNDIQKLRKFTQGLYIGKDEPRWPNKTVLDKVLFITYVDGRVCIRLKGSSENNLKRIIKINAELKKSKLNDLHIGVPYRFEEEVVEWWKEEDNRPKGNFWTSLVHWGPAFDHLDQPYQVLDAFVTYKGKRYQLTPEEERVASYYVDRMTKEKTLYNGKLVDDTTSKITTKRIGDKLYEANFWEDWKKTLSPERKKVFKDFNEMKWYGGERHLFELIVQEKEKKKVRAGDKKTKATDTQVRAIRRAEKEQRHGFAILDGSRLATGNFTVDQPGLFEGRGEQPRRGSVKRLTQPEDVTLNLSKGAPIPPAPKGHKWGEILHNPRVRWLASWPDPSAPMGGKPNPKYMQLSDKSPFKGVADLKKFEAARKLQRYIEKIRKHYMKDAKSDNQELKQVGTILWLIDRHGLRPGGEKDETETAGTIGASTLLVRNIKINASKSEITFDFLGKDSIQYTKTIKVPSAILKNFQSLVKGKASGDQLFHKISAQTINKYLKQFDQSFTNKTFRTRLASCLMYKALKNISVSAEADKAEIERTEQVANAEVAKVLNHKRTTTPAALVVTEKRRAKVVELRAKLKEAKSEEQTTKVAKLEKQLQNAKAKLETREATADVAIGTSLKNYIDPRIIVSWAERQEEYQKAPKLAQKIEKTIYSTTLRDKFRWAIEGTNSKWDWEKTPLRSELQPKEVQVSRPPREPKQRNESKADLKSQTRAWARAKWGRDWWKADDKTARLKEAKKALKYVAYPGRTEADWKLLLKICEGKMDLSSLSNLTSNTGPDGTKSSPALRWLYPFLEYAVNVQGAAKGSIAAKFKEETEKLLSTQSRKRSSMVPSLQNLA